MIMPYQLVIMNIGLDILSYHVHAFRKMIIDYFTVISRLIRHGNAQRNDSRVEVGNRAFIVDIVFDSTNCSAKHAATATKHTIVY